MTSGRSSENDEPGANHPAVGELVDYVHGELSQRRAAGIRAHLARCADCGDQLAALMLLREDQLRVADETPPLATVTRFPVPARAPARRWQVGAAAAVLFFALLWLGRPDRVTEPPDPVMQGLPSAIEFETVAGDIDQVLAAVDILGMRFAGGAQAAAAGGLSDDDLIAEALRLVGSGDLSEARALLEPFGERWDRAGTALLGYVTFLLRDPAAFQVLEMYAAGHSQQMWEADAGSPEDLAFFFLARLRHALGDDAGAREAVRWIDPRMDTGRAATAWLQETLGD